MVRAGLFIAAFFPAVALFGLASFELMGCTGGGSSGPVGGCRIFGLEFNFFAALATPAFVASFFSVPIGLLICVASLVSTATSRVFKSERAFGIYDASGSLLPFPHASRAISQFDRDACDKLLRAFGGRVSVPSEPLEEIRQRCVEVLGASKSYGA